MSKKQQNCELHISKNGVSAKLNGLPPEQVTGLSVYAAVKTDLSILSQYPNLGSLYLYGEITEVDSLRGCLCLRELNINIISNVDFSGLKGLPLQTLEASCPVEGSFSELLSDHLKYLHLYNIRKTRDLNFIQKASKLRKLYLESLPAAELLPDFSQLPELKALKLYELHKLGNMEQLADSNIAYLSVALAADSLSGSRLADILLQMKSLQQADVHLLDRSGKKYGPLRNKFIKEGKVHLLTEQLDYEAWKKL